MRVFWILLSLAITISGILVFMPEADERSEAINTASPASSNDATAPAPPAPSENRVERADTTQVPAETEVEYGDAPSADLNGVLQTNETVAESPVSTEAPTTEVATSDAPDITADDIIAELDGDDDAQDLMLEAEADDAASETEAGGEVAELATPADADAVEEANEEVSGWEALAKNSETTDAASSEETAGAPAEAEAPAEAPKPMTIARTGDGSISIGGGKYIITGAGTKADPYVLPWEYMVSIRESYDPRNGKKEIPAHIAMFDGAYITIAGYLQFPLAAPEPTECLVMLNQWDGCCIGVPPTPYDAIEVALAEPAGREQKFAVEGRVVGKLKIDPYLVGNWLIGLYLMEDAFVDVSGSRTAEEVYGNTPSQLIPPVE